jgi:3alpha(or 20beta)-hydroxysteroid dehydrogenase
VAVLSGKTILITGAARGQGAAEARLFVLEGAKVVITDIREEEGQVLAAELGNAARFMRHDVASPDDWARITKAAEDIGGFCGLVNNAGLLDSAALLDTTMENWERHIAVNQTSCFLGMQSVVPAFERAGGGSIVNVSSSVAMRSAPRSFAYGATKWAVRGMSRSAAVELAPRGIRVNAIYPGPTDTRMLDVWTPQRRVASLARVPMGRLGKAEEIAPIALLLLSDAASFMTGAEIAVDGGFTA